MMQNETLKKPTLGQKIAEKIAGFCGSWYFVACFFTLVMVWISVNKALDLNLNPLGSYPLLNLVLSCIGLVQSPIIMMAQQRAEKKDRERSQHDHDINVKAESQIRLLHEKMDKLLAVQKATSSMPELS